MITALVVDDARIMADSLCQMLNLMDVQAYPAYGSRAALVSLNEKTPNVVFVDLNMPGLGGFEVIGYLRRDPLLESIPIFFVTSDDQAETAQKAMQLGVLDILIKPVTFEIIEEALKKAKLI
jgi:two-component system, sensor histidine kinase and response regulator